VLEEAALFGMGFIPAETIVPERGVRVSSLRH
jgi:hypothetical protein